MSQVGYARVSSTGQSLEVQLNKLQHCNKVFSEKKSATSTNGRTELKDCLSYLREGDQLVITRLDRLARSVLESMQNRGRQLSNLFQFFIIRRPKAGIPASKHLFQFAVEYPCPHLQE